MRVCSVTGRCAIPLVLFLLISLEPNTSAQTGAAREAATATVQTFITANENRDLEKIVSTFADDATVFFPGEPSARVSGKESIRQVFAALFKQRAGAITIKPTDIAVQLFGDTAIVTAHLERN